MLSWEAARRFANDGVSVTCCHPGATASALNVAVTNGGLTTHTPEQTAALPLYLALDPNAGNVSGRWFAFGNDPKNC
jgi:NAD(P)-dependent dehydrogenase (short-subunit alcohol dehydrogenase family)